MAKKPAQFVIEAEKKRPVLFDVDVVIAGAGLCSTFAAIAAGRCGAGTLVVERLSSVGGNIGPGMIVAGGLFGEAKCTLPGGLAGIAREFQRRFNKHRAGLPLRGPKGARVLYARDAAICSHVAYEMMKEAGVKVLLTAQASDPIMQGGRVKGIFVDCKGGRFAVKAKVTVDGTGDADIALRAGAPIVRYLPISRGKGPDTRYHTVQAPLGMIRDKYMSRAHPTFYNDTRLIFFVADADLEAWRKFCGKKVRLSAALRKRAAKKFPRFPQALWPVLGKMWKGDNSPFQRWVPLDFRFGIMEDTIEDHGGITAMYIAGIGAIDSGDALQTANMEAELHRWSFKMIEFLRKHAPGFERAYIHSYPSYFSFRGGPHIEGEHTLTVEEQFIGRRSDDVLFRNTHEKVHGGDAGGYDVPLSCVVPKKIDGLLVCGRGAAYMRRGHDPSGLRARPSMMVLGETVGTVAAVAARAGVSPKKVDIKKVQKILLKSGLFLGDKRRLKALGLAK